MEKRTLLAILLSTAFIFVYYSLLSKTQPIGRQDVKGIQPVVQPVKPEVLARQALAPERSTHVAVPVKRYVLETNKLELTFSNLGASIDDIYLKDYNAHIFGSKFLSIEEFDNLPFTLRETSSGAIFIYQDQDDKIEKVFKFADDSYLIDCFLKITNLSNQSKEYNLHLTTSLLELSKVTSGGGSRRYDLLEYSISLPDTVLRKSATSLNDKREIITNSAVNWTGIRNNYFCSILELSNGTSASGYFSKPVGNKSFTTGILVTASIASAGSSSVDFKLFAGPQDRKTMLAQAANLVGIISYGKLTPIANLILKILELAHRAIPNWGVSIIILTLLISIILGPLTLKSLKSMKEMQQLQPEMDRLRKAHKGDTQKLNKEIMQLYRQHKVNPFGGCLPMFLQFPVMIALFLALTRSLGLRGAKFLWIKDLSVPDRLFMLPRQFPVIGNEINLLPILMAVAMFFQQKMSSKSTASMSAEQQKMMLIMFPIMFTFLFYHFPSGLSLYWTCYTIISILMQRKLLYSGSK